MRFKTSNLANVQDSTSASERLGEPERTCGSQVVQLARGELCDRYAALIEGPYQACCGWGVIVRKGGDDQNVGAVFRRKRGQLTLVEGYAPCGRAV